MKYTVVWKPEAERRLAELWMEADDPERFAEAANLIDHELAVSPASVGEQRISSIHVVIVPPAGVYRGFSLWRAGMMGGMDQNPYESPRVADKPAAAPMHFRLRTLLISLLGLGAPVVCGIACIATLVAFRDYRQAYHLLAAPFVPMGIAGYLSRRSPWASAYWLAVSVGIAKFVSPAWFGNDGSLSIFNARTGPRSEPSTGMGVGMGGIAEWAMVAAAIPIGFAIWWLTRDRRQAQVATLNDP